MLLSYLICENNRRNMWIKCNLGPGPGNTTVPFQNCLDFITTTISSVTGPSLSPVIVFCSDLLAPVSHQAGSIVKQFFFFHIHIIYIVIFPTTLGVHFSFAYRIPMQFTIWMSVMWKVEWCVLWHRKLEWKQPSETFLIFVLLFISHLYLNLYVLCFNTMKYCCSRQVKWK